MSNYLSLVILCGGPGSRLGKLTEKNPKPLLKIKNIPFLEILLRKYSKYCFENIYLLCGHKSDQIIKKFDKKIFNFIPVKCFKEKKRLDTWGAVCKIKNKISNDFILMNGDSLLDDSLHNFIRSNNRNNNKLGMFLIKNLNYNSNQKLSNLDIKKNRVFASSKGKLMNAGIYYIKKELFNDKKILKFKSIENELIPYLLNKKKVLGIKSDSFFIDIGTVKNYLDAQKSLFQKLQKPSIFLDRDGVINHDYGYVHKMSQFKLRNGVIKGLQRLIKNNYQIFLVTNQAGIGKGYYTYKDFELLHKTIKFKMSKFNIYFDDVWFSPFYKKSKIKKYRKLSRYRKPGNQMINEIFKKWHINKKIKNFMIGDKKSDQLCARKSGLKFYYAKKNFNKQIISILS